MVPSSPLFKLHFPLKGGGVTGIWTCAGRALGQSPAAGNGAEPLSYMTPGSGGNPRREEGCSAALVSLPPPLAAGRIALGCLGQLRGTWLAAVFP